MIDPKYPHPPTASSYIGPPSILDHDLNQYFPGLLKFESTSEMEASELYKKIRPDVARIMDAVVSEPPALAGGQNLSVRSSNANTFGARNWPPAHAGGSDPVRALAWNLERGIRLDGIIDSLKTNRDLKNKDMLLLTELDHGMARSGNRFVAQEIANALHLNYAFAPVYIPLQKGSGVEANVPGENTLSLHGVAMMSPHSMKNVHAVPLPNGKDKMRGPEKRLGHLRALIADIEHPAAMFRAVTVHLDAHCSRAHRHKQMKIILDHLETLPPLPVIIGGDWNTTTYNAQNATRAILGYARRVIMGVRNVAKNHFPHPDRYFERRLFGELESRGFEYKSLNEIGAGTLHYDMESVETNTNLRDWVPGWCMPFIFWAAHRVGGRVSVRLDWFAGKHIAVAPGSKPQTVGNLIDVGGLSLSDHDAVAVDFVSVARTCQ